MSSENPSAKSLTLGYWDSLGKIKILNGLTAAKRLQRASEFQQEMVEAEGRKVAESLDWKLSEEDEEMGDTVLGDMVNHHHHQPKQSGGLAKAAGIAALLLGGPAAGYVVNDIVDKFTSETPPAVDTDTLFDIEIVPSE